MKNFLLKNYKYIAHTINFLLMIGAFKLLDLLSIFNNIFLTVIILLVNYIITEKSLEWSGLNDHVDNELNKNK